jgi:hypothetical protein
MRIETFEKVNGAFSLPKTFDLRGRLRDRVQSFTP